VPAAARVGDPTGHPGTIAGPGDTSVLIAGQPAAVEGTNHSCSIPPQAGPHPPTPIARGSATVSIGGKAAARVGDTTGCGSPIVSGATTVVIGG
jgi:uncharacterized Zn-binding protein involved in type VI secretion